MTTTTISRSAGHSRRIAETLVPTITFSLHRSVLSTMNFHLPFRPTLVRSSEIDSVNRDLYLSQSCFNLRRTTRRCTLSSESHALKNHRDAPLRVQHQCWNQQALAVNGPHARLYFSKTERTSHRASNHDRDEFSSRKFHRRIESGNLSTGSTVDALRGLLGRGKTTIVD